MEEIKTVPRVGTGGSALQDSNFAWMRHGVSYVC